MSVRPALAVLAATAALASSAMLAPAAQAAPAASSDPITCTINSATPGAITVGTTSQVVRFGVHTSCDGTYPVLWSLQSDIYVNSYGYSWLQLRNAPWPQTPHSSWVVNAQGDYSVGFVGKSGQFVGNQMAGEHPYTATAYPDVNGDGLPDEADNATVTRADVGPLVLKRATTFGHSFSASAKRHHGRTTLTFGGRLKRADWDTGKNAAFAAPVQLQFRSGKHKYHTIATTAGSVSSVKISVKAKSGRYRLVYPGDSISGVSHTRSIRVFVTH